MKISDVSQRLDTFSMPFKWFYFGHLKRFYLHYLGAVISLVILHFAQAQVPQLAKELGEATTLTKLNAYPIWKLPVLALLIIFFRSFSRLLFFYPARIDQKYWRVELLQKLSSHHTSRFQAWDSGQLYQSLFDDLNRMRGALGFGLLQIVNIVIALVIYLPLFFKLSSEMLITTSSLVSAMLIFSALMMVYQKYMKQELEYAGEYQNQIMESYKGKHSVQNYFVEQNFINWNNRLSKLELDTFAKTNHPRIFAQPLIKLGLGISLWWGAHILHRNGQNAAELIFFSGLLYLILEPMLFLGWIGLIIAQAQAAWLRLKKLNHHLTTVSEIELELQKINTSHHTNDLNNSNEKQVSFKIPFWNEQLAIDLRPEQGKWFLFFGETGVGKTTMLKHLFYLLSNQFPGEVRFVSQEVTLYNDKIYHNLFLYDERNPDLKLAEEFHQLFGLHDVNPNFTEFLETEVGELGKKLSGGQAKRIGLMRSLLFKPKFILWDDPCNSVDVINEAKILSTVRNHPAFKDTIFILTGHRFSTLKNMDYFFYLNKKEILEHGQWSQFNHQQVPKSYEFFSNQIS